MTVKCANIEGVFSFGTLTDGGVVCQMWWHTTPPYLHHHIQAPAYGASLCEFDFCYLKESPLAIYLMCIIILLSIKIVPMKFTPQDVLAVALRCLQ